MCASSFWLTIPPPELPGVGTLYVGDCKWVGLVYIGEGPWVGKIFRVMASGLAQQKEGDVRIPGKVR